MKVSIHTASRIGTRLSVARVSMVRVSVRVRIMAIHKATGEASRLYSVSLFTFQMKVSNLYTRLA